MARCYPAKKVWMSVYYARSNISNHSLPFKGIFLNAEAWKKLVELVPKITEKLEAMQKK